MLFQASVNYEGNIKNIEIFVVNGGGPALLGRYFLALFEMQIAKVNNCSGVTKIQYYTEKFPKLFSVTLGRLKKFKVIR